MTQRIVGTVALLLFASIIVFLAVNSVLTTCEVEADETVRTHSDAVWLHATLFAALVGGLWLLERTGERWLTAGREAILTCCVAALLGGAMALCVALSKSLPIFDQRICIEIAMGLAQGNADSWGSYYLRYFPFQIPFVLYCVPLAWLGGAQTVLALQLANVVAAMAAAWALGECAVLLFGQTRLRLTTWLGCLAFLPLWFYTPFVYGNLVGLCLMLLGARQLLRYVRDHQKRQLLGLTSLFVLATLLKMNYAIAGLAAGIVLALDAIGGKRLSAGIAAALLVALCLTGNRMVARTAQTLTGQNFTEGFPTSSWIMLGLEEEEGKAPGWYNNHAYDLYQRLESRSAVDEIAKEEIGKRVRALAADPGYAVDFLTRKTLSIWNEPSFQSLQINEVARNPERAPQMTSVYEGSKKNLALGVMDQAHCLLLLGVVLWLALGARRATLGQLFFPTYLVGGFLFHLVWEAKGQYTLQYLFCLIPYAMTGYRLLLRRLGAHTRKRGEPA